MIKILAWTTLILAYLALIFILTGRNKDAPISELAYDPFIAIGVFIIAGFIGLAVSHYVDEEESLETSDAEK